MRHGVNGERCLHRPTFKTFQFPAWAGSLQRMKLKTQLGLSIIGNEG